MLQSQKLKQKHNQLVLKITELDKLENPTSDQKEEAEKRFIELEDLGKKIKRQLALEAIAKPQNSPIPQKELKEYSLAKALQFFSGKPLEGREKECHQELKKITPRTSEKQVIIPLEVLMGKVEKRQVGGQSALISDPIRPELYLESLREASLMDKLNVRRISANNSFNYPKNSNNTTSNWFSATGGSTANDKIAESDMTFDSEESRPHYLSTRSGWTLDQITQMSGNLSLEEKIRMDMAENMRESLDDAFLNANSTTSAPQPDGLLKKLGTKNNTAINLTSSVKFKLQNWVDLRKDFRVQYKNNAAMPISVFSPLVESELAVEQKFTGSDGDSLLESIGPFVVTNHLADTKVLYGDFSNFLFITYGGLSLERGYMNNDFETAVQRIRAILAADFVMNREEGFRQLTITRTG